MLDLALALTLALSPAPVSAQEPTPIEAPITEVTVFPGQAQVVRRVTLDATAGSFLLAGLPWGLDPNSVRARCEGAVVVGIETRDRKLPAMPDERIAELRARQRQLEREIQGLEGQTAVLTALDKHLRNLLNTEADDHKQDVREGRATPEVWTQNLEFLGQQLAANSTERREILWKIEDLTVELDDVRMEIGRDRGQGALVRDVIVELAAGSSEIVLEVEYLVHGATWRPMYDLRTASNARRVDLAYRAQVSQSTGEDWKDVQLLLSTARPNVGAQGPDPRPIWLWIEDPEELARRGRGAKMESLQALGYAGSMEEDKAFAMADAPAPAASLMAAVEHQGLSARFRLATRETIESRNQPTNVLVGEAHFDVAPEYYATPALDTNVWLRGVAKNTSDWIMLPGRASVYFGADFIGHSQLDAVQPGQEFDLHLGADPALTLERTRTDDLTKKPGMFGSRMRREEGWRITLTNNGAAVAAADGSATVIVREALPRPKDDRIKVELAKTSPKPSDAERWAQDFADEGILTWELKVPGGAAGQILYRTEISYPSGLNVRR